jgi:Chalcone isomerase-like
MDLPSQISLAVIMKSLIFSIIGLFFLSIPASAMTDKATGISFPPKKNGLEIFGVGVRKKGPIKIYSVACYGSSSLKESLSSLSRSKEEKEALSTLRDGIKSDDASFLLEMSFKVGAAKMASAIAESVAPRHNGNANDVDRLRDLIFNGVPEKGATKGTTFQFDCKHASGVDVTVNGKNLGSVPSPELAAAFCDVYCDNDCVSPALRSSCLENCCAA